MSFQDRVVVWLKDCFKNTSATSIQERCDRFLEETLELLQALGYDRKRIAKLVDHVYAKPVGDPQQEAGGVMLTLAAMCWTAGLDVHEAGERELARVSEPEMMARIRAKDDAKSDDGPLPGAV